MCEDVIHSLRVSLNPAAKWSRILFPFHRENGSPFCNQSITELNGEKSISSGMRNHFFSTKVKVKMRGCLSLGTSVISWHWIINPRAETFLQPGCHTSAGSGPSDAWCPQRDWHLSACNCRITLHLSPPPTDRVCVTAVRKAQQERYAMELSGWIRHNVIRCRSLLRDQQWGFFLLASWVRI